MSNDRTPLPDKRFARAVHAFLLAARSWLITSSFGGTIILFIAILLIITIIAFNTTNSY